MKDFLKIFLIIIAGIITGAYLQKCQSPLSDTARNDYVSDTITVYDTVKHIAPTPLLSQQAGTKQIKIPLSSFVYRIECFSKEYANQTTDSLPKIRADTTQIETTDVAAETDSITLQLPLTQNVYEGKDYKAYVSGIYPSLDSIFVYSQCERITIKKPPKRWHIGPAVGYGYTPQGFKSYIGLNLTYSIISF